MEPKNPVWNFFALLDQDRCKTVKRLLAPKLQDFEPTKMPTNLRKVQCLQTILLKSQLRRHPEPVQYEFLQPVHRPVYVHFVYLDEQIAKLLFACNLPFNKTGHAVLERNHPDLSTWVPITKSQGHWQPPARPSS